MALLPYEIVLIATLFSVLFLGTEDSTFYRTHRMKNLPAHSIIRLPEHTTELFVDIRESLRASPIKQTFSQNLVKNKKTATTLKPRMS